MIFSTTSSGGISSLGINWSAFVIQLITFLIVFWILKRYAFQPILRVLKNRRDFIEDGVKLGQEMKLKNTQFEEEIDKQLHQARATADGLISSAEEQARDILLDAEDAAKQKTELILLEAQERIKLETHRAKNRLEKEIVELISEATEAIIEEKIDAKKDAQLIDKVLKRSKVGT